MPQPTVSDVHVNRPLTTYSTAFVANQEDFIAMRAFPFIPSESKSDEYWVYDRADWARLVAEKRAAGTASAGGGYTIARQNFSVERWAIHQDVDDPTRANADDPLAPDQDATTWVTEQILRAIEREWNDNYFVTGIWDQEVTPATLWDAGGSTPIEDVRSEHTRILSITGKRPNTIVTTPYVRDVLIDHPDVLDRIKYTGSGAVTIDEAQLAELFKVERFLVGGGFETTSQEGAATDTFDFMLGKNLWLGYVNPSPSPRTVTAGGTFVWTGNPGTGATGQRIKRFRLEEYESDRIEGETWFDQQIIANDCGMLFLAPIS